DYFQYVFENGGNASAVESLISLAAAKKCSLSTFLVGADDCELNVSDGGDAVTITTVHASKGLEYDFVIVADIGRRFNMRDASDKCMTAGGGVAVKYPDGKTRTLKCSARWLLERYAVPDRMRAEELRLFYVALTRAKKRLVVCGRPSRTAHEPTAAMCEYDFMRNVAARRFEFVPRESKKQGAELPLDRAIVDAVKSRMTDEYNIKDVPIKTCVTAIAERSDDDAYFAPILTYDDRTASEEDDGYRKLDIGNVIGADAAKRGTAYHRAMELIDFSSPDVEAVKQSMDDSKLVDFDAVLVAAAEMKKLTDGAKAYFKERYFIADMPLDGENTLVQGVIDLMIVNADGTATIVDYKTTDPAHLLSDNYLKQLSLYAAAVEKSSPLKVTSTYLYSFVLGKSIKCSRK
ncbi:MAG: PD-(D/E)XK nuclease family protein, partial [Clostridiales bacterium]|nr:PD-(D/E)XK nuclease family protein [Clostridiales bacterium]